MERHRRINQTGTRESAVSDAIKEKLDGWNTAWTHLKDDSILESGLEDLNAGQSHRSRFITEAPPQPPAGHLEEALQFSRELGKASRYRGGGRGGRGGGFVGGGPVRNVQRRVPVPKLALPDEYMSHVYAAAARTSKAETNLPTASSSTIQSTLETGRPQASGAFPKSEVANAPTAAPATGILLDPEGHSADDQAENLPSRSYAEDLLGVDFNQSNNLPAPIQFSEKVEEDESYIKAPAAEFELREVDSQLAYFLPLLQSVLTPDAVEQLAKVRLQLQQKISVTPSRQLSGLSSKDLANSTHLAASGRLDPAHTTGKRTSAAPQSLAHTVEERKREWSQQIIASTVFTKGSIFGEHVTRSQLTQRRKPQPLTTSTSGLVEGFKKLHLDDEKPSPPGEETKDVTQYSDINPFGAKSTAKRRTIFWSTQAHHGRVIEPHSADRTQGTQLSDHLRSTSKSEHHAAAAKIQDTGPVPGSRSALANPPKSMISTSREIAQLPSKASPTGADDTLSLADPFPHANKQSNLRKDSITSNSASTTSPGLGEGIVRARRTGEFHQPAPVGIRPNRPEVMSKNIRTTAGPRPPQFLTCAIQPTGDPGAAARAQYGLSVSTRGGSRVLSNAPATTTDSPNHGPSLRPKAQESSDTPRYNGSGILPEFNRATAPAPQIATWLPKSKTTGDPAAAAAAQYGGKENQKH
ncbi:MAG: hypothetical protein Q9219_000209 [cf. Caloplaca sp. 3 TL-2023]